MQKKIILILTILVMTLGTVPAFGIQKNLSQETIAEYRTEKPIQYSDNKFILMAFNSTDLLSSNISFKKVAEIHAYNPITNTIKTMYLYEGLGSEKITAYRLRSNNLMLNAIVTIAKACIGLQSGTPLACKVYEYSYYGEDADTGEKSATLNDCGRKYVAIDISYMKYFNNKYYDGFVYGKINDIDDYNLCAMIVNNLYGPNYDAKY